MYQWESMGYLIEFHSAVVKIDVETLRSQEPGYQAGVVPFVRQPLYRVLHSAMT